MAMQLFEHNKTAYDAAVTMLSERGKAAVIHPTGTGKSFIGFKLCEDNPDKTICWLSPSKYIYQTQLENLAETSDGYQPENVKFYTYAKLMNVTKDEIAEIQPDYIILDEFHRCGAELWGAGVDAVLKAYPDVPVLGLSATAIRYLDNQRDMTDELFDGNVASEMTLGEAIVRGILNPPKYVLTVYSYQKELEKYETKIAGAKSKAVRDEATKYLEALRRTLENADGLDVIFNKHIENRSGKYIVFCSSLETMSIAVVEADSWFAKIDCKPHIYKAYSNDPETSKAFAEFKADRSEHLKLLYCIDMLNEGVHVEDISGVILLRPTVSPIIYKQQIGRALSASKSTNAVIFDIVNNIENLYSIDTIKEEMQAAITYYRYTGDSRVIVNDHFEVLDEVRDCRKLFDELEGVLSASWDIMYEKAKEYYEQNGDLIIPANYHTEEGYALGRWLTIQRLAYADKTDKPLTQVQIDKLEAIGVVWDSHLDYIWNRYFEKAKEYYEQNGDLNVPRGYIVDGLKLSIWLQRMRSAYANKRYTVVTPEKKKLLDSIGMVWNPLSDQWEKNYLEAMEYFNEHGSLYMDYKYITPSGLKLGYWITHLRQKKDELTDEQIARLDRIGMVWNTMEYKFEHGYKYAVRYYHQNGNLNPPITYITDDGFRLGYWLEQKRRQNKKGTLCDEYIKRLEEIGMLWKPTKDLWQQMFDEAKKYLEENGDLNVPQDYKTAQGRKLCAWLTKQRRDRREGNLSEDKIRQLDSLGMRWETYSDELWDTAFGHLENYVREHGNTDFTGTYICDDGFKLGDWVERQRRLLRRKNCPITEEHKVMLEKYGITASFKGSKATTREEAWNIGFEELKKYISEFGSKIIPEDYTTEEGAYLRYWVIRQYKLMRKGELSDDKLRKINSLGIDIKCLIHGDRGWSDKYEALKNFIENCGRLPRSMDSEKPLAIWVSGQKRLYSNGKLSAERTEKLRSIGVEL